MKGYSETEIFTAEEKLLFVEAKKIVRHFPARDAQDRWVRCHEVARVVGATLGLEVTDGHYGLCEHSWLWTTPLVPLSSPPNILDPYVVGRLPSVQLVRSSTSVPFEYRRGGQATRHSSVGAGRALPAVQAHHPLRRVAGHDVTCGEIPEPEPSARSYQRKISEAGPVALTMTLSLLVPQEALPKVYKRLDKLARSAGVLCEEVPGTTTLIADKRTLVCARFTIGDLPSVGGYEFAARIEHTKDGNVIVRGPGETQDLDESWRSAEPLCSHCGKKRSRKETFLLRQYGVALLQIGRNCLADFLMTDPSKMVALAELVKAIREESDDERWGSYGGHWEVAPVAFVACAVASTERYGFVRSSEENSTRQNTEWLSGPAPTGAYIQWSKEQPTEDQIECAHLIVAWAARPGENASEYRWNLSLAVKQPGIGKHAGLLASAPAAYFRELGKRLEKKSLDLAPEGYAVAEKGDVFKGEAVLVRHFLKNDEQWNTSKAICTFRTDAGHEIVWFASGIAPKPDMIGLRFQIKGRCKKLREASGNFARQTVLSRVTWKPVLISEPQEKQKSA